MLYGWTFQNILLKWLHVFRDPTTPKLPKQFRFGLIPVRSPLLGESLLFSFPTGTKMFQFPAFASIYRWMTGLQPAGLSHSDICGSKVICTYPQLFAAYHVLHRLREPRHPPCALIYFFRRSSSKIDDEFIYLQIIDELYHYIYNNIIQ